MRPVPFIQTLLLSLLLFPQLGRAAANRPNILVIITDQQSADAMSYRLGERYLKTPNMDRLASEGVYFTRAYCAAPLCVPSRTAMFTGRYPHETGVLSNAKGPFDPAPWPSLGAHFKAAGYDTGYVGKWHVHYPITDPASGFDYTANIRNNGADAQTPAAVAAFLEKKRAQPFLLFASFVNPHNICQWPRGQDLPDGAIGDPPPLDDCPPPPPNLAPQTGEPDAIATARREYQANPLFPVGDFKADRWRQYRWAYYRMIEKTDAYLGDILAALDRAGHADDTVIVFTSDHGDCQGAHGWNQKTVFYDESSRVPFIIRDPRAPAPGRDATALVQTGIDLLPTLCDLAGITPPEGLPGVSQRPAAEGRADAPARPYVVASILFLQGEGGPEGPATPAGRMLRADRFKYCVYDYGSRRESLVDLTRDPGETTNLVDDPAYAKVLDQQRATLLAWAQENGDDSFPFIKPQNAPNTSSSAWVNLGPDGRLVYTPDERGNRVPDFSGVGYRNGDQPIPDVPVVATLSPVEGDDLPALQAAIDALAARPLGPDGFRGAILLTAGAYELSDTLTVSASGIVLRGAGEGPDGTTLIATRRAKHNLIRFNGAGLPEMKPGSARKIAGDYIPVGATRFEVGPRHHFSVGDRVMLQRRPNLAWIQMLGMDKLKAGDPDDRDWTTLDYTVNYQRIVVATDDTAVELDAPLMDPIDANYAEGFIYRYEWPGRLENVGIEQLALDTVYADEDDEAHAWSGVSFERVEHGWMRSVTARHFAYAAVDIADESAHITVSDCQMLDPMARTRGSRKYSFNVDGQRNLIERCFARGGRHDFVTGSTTPGPNVFVDCRAENQKNDIGPHHRWSTGLLFDNVVGDGEFNVQNRVHAGTGHGWAGAQVVLWNCQAALFRVQHPPEHFNWVFGCVGEITNRGRRTNDPIAIVESPGQLIPAPSSLYRQQLQERHARAVLEKP